MALRRGVLYRVPFFKRAFGLVVLTNDEWNDATTQDLAGALAYNEVGAGRVAIPRTDVWVGTLLALPKTDLAEAVRELDPRQLRIIEGALADALALPELLAHAPRAPQGLAGAIDYPRWSNVYYAGPQVGEPPERKRYVAVTRDEHNHALGGAVFVRTTTSPRRGGRGIPVLRDATRAICTLPTFIATASVRMRRGDARPEPAQFFLPDMAAIARGLGEALELST